MSDTITLQDYEKLLKRSNELCNEHYNTSHWDVAMRTLITEEIAGIEKKIKQFEAAEPRFHSPNGNYKSAKK